jgi:secondary thiamine-phosphate synthase enzyme
MRLSQHRITIRTTGIGLVDVTAEVAGWLAAQPIRAGLLTILIRHTSASLVIQENADPDVRVDLLAFFRRLVPEDGRPGGLYRHTDEGPDDMPAHIRSALLATTLSIPVEDGCLALGTWQGIYVFEHRRAPHDRQLALTLLGT